MSSVQPGIGPRGVCALCEGLAGEATARLIVQVGFEIGARDRAASGEAVVLAGPGRARRAQQALEASVAVAGAAVDEDGSPGVSGAAPFTGVGGGGQGRLRVWEGVGSMC